MRELTGRAQADIRKLIGGVPWIELLEVRFPDYFVPTAAERKFLAQSPDGAWYALLTNVLNDGMIAQEAAGWETEGLAAGYKWFFSVPYERDTVADSNEKQGMMDSRVTLGDAGGVIYSIAERCDGFHKAVATLGFAMQKGDAGDNVALGDGVIECYEPEVVLDFTISQPTFNGKVFACLLTSDTPLEWKFPARVMLKNVCHFQFKGLECGFTGDIAQLVTPTRAGNGELAIFPGYWALSGGYIERLAPDGEAIMKRGVGSLDSYVFMASTANNYYFAARTNHRGLHWYNGTTNGFFPSSGGAQTILSNDYPFAHTISSGGYMDAYAITNTAATRHLYHFVNDVATQVGTGQYFNIVSSPVPGVCYAIQGGAYSGAGGAFVQSNSATGRLVRVEGETITDIGGGRLYKWCRASGFDLKDIFLDDPEMAGILNIDIHVMDSNGGLWYVGDYRRQGGEWVQSTTLRVEYYFLEGKGLTGEVNLPAVPVSAQFSNTNFLNAALFYIVDGKLYGGFRDGVYFLDDSTEWTQVTYVPIAPDYEEGLALAVNVAGVSVLKFQGFDGVPYATSNRIQGSVKAILPLASFNEGNLGFYYIAGGEVRLSRQQHFATCDHTLTDCKERGNEVRFGGFPGIGSGGLTQ